MSNLFEPLNLGALHLKNRIIMAPLTRARSPERVPTDLVARYYAQRAQAGLILTEATSVSSLGVGYADTPGIWTAEQTEAWRNVTEAVHAAGGLIALQLWHVGRISDPSFLNGNPPVAPSEIAAEGHVSLLRPERPYPVPRALEIPEIRAVVEEFRRGAENAKKAGFDGVEIHGANGYLVDQFLQSSTNKRTDEYGGSIENRARFALEVADAVSSVWGADKVGMHIAPRGDAHDMGDSDPRATFTYLAEELGKRGLAFLFAREHEAPDSLASDIRRAFGGPLILNEGFTKESAERAITEGRADAVSFGKSFIANPDLVERFRTGAELNTPDPSTFYGGGEKGYVDYPVLALS
ncbi:MAG: alkene reductase [Candidatus Eremiobacteraeota bacterium]|nr:alkene reductase [Candidatus Eremiobacteraeota bacterium]